MYSDSNILIIIEDIAQVLSVFAGLGLKVD